MSSPTARSIGTASSAPRIGTQIRPTTELPILAMLHAKEKCPRRRVARCLPTCGLPTTRLSPVIKERLAGLTGLHGRTDGPAGERLYGDNKGQTEKRYLRAAAPGGYSPSDHGPPDPVREPHAHPWLCRHGAERSLAADRGAGSTCDA